MNYLREVALVTLAAKAGMVTKRLVDTSTKYVWILQYDAVICCISRIAVRMCATVVLANLRVAVVLRQEHAKYSDGLKRFSVT